MDDPSANLWPVLLDEATHLHRVRDPDVGGAANFVLNAIALGACRVGFNLSKQRYLPNLGDCVPLEQRDAVDSTLSPGEREHLINMSPATGSRSSLGEHDRSCAEAGSARRMSGECVARALPTTSLLGAESCCLSMG